MEFKSIVSLILLFIYLAAFVLKLVLMSRESRITAFVLGNKEKDKKTNSIEAAVRTASFVWGALWFFQAIKSEYFSKLNIYMETEFSFALGVSVITLGEVLFILAMITMKNSWRVGIDKKEKSQLITQGIYKFSRNPAFVGLYSMMAGTFIAYPNYVSLFIVIANISVIHILVTHEEKHLSDEFGMKYEEYKTRTPRYLLWK